MEISQAVGSHVGGLCGDHISEHEVRTILSEPSGYVLTLVRTVGALCSSPPLSNGL
jgi:hypothetical protein